MENPNSHNEAVRIIEEAMREHAESVRAMCCGISLAQTIYNKLLAKGFLVTDKK